MPRPPKIWLTTDTHFNHNKMVETCGRPENFSELIILNLRKFVARQDVLVHLGDVIFYPKRGQLKAILDNIPGKSKVLTMGNHDRKTKSWYLSNGFDVVCQSIQIGDIILSHKPLFQFPDGARVNVHGHFHNTDHQRHEPRPWYSKGRHRLLALEYTDYQPVELHEFVKETD